MASMNMYDDIREAVKCTLNKPRLPFAYIYLLSTFQHTGFAYIYLLSNSRLHLNALDSAYCLYVYLYGLF